MSFRPYHWPCFTEDPHSEHDHCEGPDGYMYHCAGVRQKACRCSYLPWEAARHPTARAMRASVFLINPFCLHHGMPAAGWIWVAPGYWMLIREHSIDLLSPDAALYADLRGFQGSGRHTPTPWPERQSSVKQLTTGKPR